MLIGAHVSISQSFDQCLDRAAELGANCLQTFASSPRSLKTAEFPQPVIEKYLRKKSAYHMGPHFFHGVYLINLASENREYVQASVGSLNFYQKFAGEIGGAGTIFHIGSHKGRGFGTVKNQIIEAVTEAAINTPLGVRIFLENAAGAGGVIGADFDEIGEIIKGIPPELRTRLAVCLDTQHALASGYELRSEAGIRETLEKFDRSVGLEYLMVVHANDSKIEPGGHRDRHENIGKGFIGESGFAKLLSHPKLKNLPFILEVPGENKSGPRKEDVELMKSLAGIH